MKNILLISIIILICVIPSREISAQSVRSNKKLNGAAAPSSPRFDGYRIRDSPNFTHELSVKDLKFKRPGKQHRMNKNGKEHDDPSLSNSSSLRLKKFPVLRYWKYEKRLSRVFPCRISSRAKLLKFHVHSFIYSFT